MILMGLGKVKGWVMEMDWEKGFRKELGKATDFPKGLGMVILMDLEMATD